MSCTCNVPVRGPVCVGVKITLILQRDFAARLDAHVVAETLKSPVVEIAMPVSATLCLLERTNTLAGLALPTFSVGNVAFTGVSVACAVPVPESAALCGLLGALSLICSAPLRAPSSVGVNVTLMLQFFPTANELPHVVELTAKSPVAAMLLMFSVAAPLLIRVMLFAADVLPTT